jgi:O-antigen biosynthesis protein
MRLSTAAEARTLVDRRPSPPPAPVRPVTTRPFVKGKFLFADDRKLYVKGVTYGPFDSAGDGFHEPRRVMEDLDAIASIGANAVRTYTIPPRWLLDGAAERGLRVMVGVPWEQHVTFLDDRRRVRDIERRVRDGIRGCAGHPAVLCYAIGNEIPSTVVRWSGGRRVERFLERLCGAAREADPDGIVVYANYPTTEYLDLPFVDVLCCNVFLERTDRLTEYVARLHVLAGDRPVVLSELGLDSRRNGLDAQAAAVEAQVRAAFAGGCAGAFVFSFTDEWHRGGEPVDDWEFGLVTRDRRPKPALAAAGRAFAEVPFADHAEWPRVSVVVCSLNGSSTISQSMRALRHIDYPDYEVIVVDDGSTDETAAVARTHGFPVISTRNMGLSSARNTGLQAATGEIVAYLDDDAYPDPQWLRYLVTTFRSTDCAGVGGPNLPPPGDGTIADCVANSPGGPIHVLISDQLAEHIPGCNMAFRRGALKAIGGFDTRFRVAGDDVDVCWRLQDRGWTLGFSPSAVVWHHRRNSVAAYWRQQRGYGRAEALLERKWPARHNAVGHVSWAGSVYGGAVRLVSGRRVRIYQGTWGMAPFQTKEAADPPQWSSLMTMPEWYLVVAAAVGLAVLGTLWHPLLLLAPLAVVGLVVPVVRAWRQTAHARFSSARSSAQRLVRRGLTAFLHLMQPVARLAGRMSRGLTPWRHHLHGRAALPFPGTRLHWRERWRSHEATLQGMEEWLRETGALVSRGSGYDGWDLEVRAGGLGSARLLMATEEHEGGRQLVRVRWWPRPSAAGLVVFGSALAAAVAAAAGAAWPVAAALGAAAAWFGAGLARQCGSATGAFLAAAKELR